MNKFISPFIPGQIPAFYNDDYPNFVAFIKAYYEWLEQSENTYNTTRNLFSTRDIDQTADQFVAEIGRAHV